MKLKFWQLGAFLAIGMWLSWWYYHSILTNTPLNNLALIQIVNNANDYSFQSVSINISQSKYSSNGEWIGRLILPTSAQINSSALTDWVWIEIKHAPATDRQLICKTIKLTWQPKSLVATDIRQVTTAIKFTPETIASQQHVNIGKIQLNSEENYHRLNLSLQRLDKSRSKKLVPKL